MAHTHYCHGCANDWTCNGSEPCMGDYLACSECKPKRWHTASGAGGKLTWWVTRGPVERLDDANGQLRRFGSRESAQKAADEANTA